MILNKLCLTLVRNLHLAIDGAHLIDGLDLRGKPAVDAKNLAVYKCSKRKVIKGLIEVFPRSGASILLDDFIIKSVDGGDLAGFVVAPEQEYLFGVFDLVAEKKLNGLNGVVAPIHKISDEDVSGLRQFPAYLEQFEHVEELSVDVSADGDGCLGFLDIGLLEEKVLDLVTECAHCLLLKVLAALQLRDPSIHLHLNSITNQTGRNIIILAHHRRSALPSPCLRFRQGTVPLL